MAFDKLRPNGASIRMDPSLATSVLSLMRPEVLFDRLAPDGPATDLVEPKGLVRIDHVTVLEPDA